MCLGSRNRLYDWNISREERQNKAKDGWAQGLQAPGTEAALLYLSTMEVNYGQQLLVKIWIREIRKGKEHGRLAITW